MKLPAVLVVACLAGVAPVTAQEPPPPAAPVGDASRPETEVTLDRGNELGAAVAFGGPLGATVRLQLLHGLGADVQETDTKQRVKAVCAVPVAYCAGGFLVGVEAGSGGGKLSLGLGASAHVDSNDFRGRTGLELKLSLARTWGSPIGTEAGLTYFGPELGVYVLRFGFDLGVLFRVSGDTGSSALFTWGLGIRL